MNWLVVVCEARLVQKLPRISVLLFGYLLFFSLAAMDVGAQSGQPLVVAPDAAPCLVIRASPDKSARRLGCLAPDTKVVGIGAAPYWRHVRLASGEKAWGAKKFFLTDSAPASALGSGDVATAPSSDEAWLEVHIVDVGQGDGIWIRTYDDGIPGNGKFEGKNIVIDGGPKGDDAKNPFLQYLMAHGAKGAKLDALFISHPHNDHYPGATGLVKNLEVCDIYDSGYPPQGPMFKNFLSVAEKAKCGNGRA